MAWERTGHPIIVLVTTFELQVSGLTGRMKCDLCTGVVQQRFWKRH